MERRNKKTKQVGNGEGSLYYSEALGCWVYQYYDTSGKRQTKKQRKKESVKDFKARVTETKNSLNNGTYLSRSYETVITLLTDHINQKHIDGITSARSYRRDLETLEQIKKTCYIFCNMPMQKVTIKHIEQSKPEMKKYANTTIDKIWSLLKKAFSLACSPSRKILIYNLMLDENLTKPISNQKTEKVKPLTHEELKKLNSVLDNEERNHPYRNIAKMQNISGMRIGEVLARSKDDYNRENKKFNIHNTLTEDENYNVVWSEHTKTYDKKKQIDLGQRFLPCNNIVFVELIEIIDEQCSKKITNIRNLLFWDYQNNDFVKPKEVDAWLKRINKKYKIAKGSLTSHRLRHSAITYWEEIGIPFGVIQYLAGHVVGSKITGKVYIDISPEYAEEALSNIV